MSLVVPQGTVVAAPVVIGSSTDLYPSHIANLGKGGLVTFDSVADRDAIPLDRREHLMEINILDSSVPKKYRLVVESWELLDQEQKNLALVDNTNWSYIPDSGQDLTRQKRILYVDQSTDYVGTPIVGDKFKPYNNISDALDDAEEGDLIKVLSDNYESFTLKDGVDIDATGFVLKADSNSGTGRTIISTSTVNCSIWAKKILYTRIGTSGGNGSAIMISGSSNVNIHADIEGEGDATYGVLVNASSSKGSLNIFGDVISQYCTLNADIYSLNVYGSLVITEGSNISPTSTVRFTGSFCNIYGDVRFDRLDCRDLSVTNSLDTIQVFNIHGNLVYNNSSQVFFNLSKNNVHVFGKVFSKVPLKNFNNSHFYGEIEFNFQETSSRDFSTYGLGFITSFTDTTFDGTITIKDAISDAIKVTEFFKDCSGIVYQGIINFEYPSFTPNINNNNLTLFSGSTNAGIKISFTNFCGTLDAISKGSLALKIELYIVNLLSSDIHISQIVDSCVQVSTHIVYSDNQNLTVGGTSPIFNESDFCTVSGILSFQDFTDGSSLFNDFTNGMLDNFTFAQATVGSSPNISSMFGGDPSNIKVESACTFVGNFNTISTLEYFTGDSFLRINTSVRIPNFVSPDLFLGTDVDGNLTLKSPDSSGLLPNIDNVLFVNTNSITSGQKGSLTDLYPTYEDAKAEALPGDIIVLQTIEKYNLYFTR